MKSELHCSFHIGVDPVNILRGWNLCQHLHVSTMPTTNMRDLCNAALFDTSSRWYAFESRHRWLSQRYVFPAQSGHQNNCIDDSDFGTKARPYDLLLSAQSIPNFDLTSQKFSRSCAIFPNYRWKRQAWEWKPVQTFYFPTTCLEFPNSMRIWDARSWQSDVIIKINQCGMSINAIVTELRSIPS